MARAKRKVSSISTAKFDGLCPHCGHPIGAYDINPSVDTVRCRQCGAWHKFKEIAPGQTGRDFDPYKTPDGVTYTQSLEGDKIAASTRSPIAFVLVPFAFIWTIGSVTGIYGYGFSGNEIDWVSILLSVPFVIGAAIAGSFGALTTFGQTAVTRYANQGTVFTGVGPFGWTRRFDWNRLQTIREFAVPVKNRRRRRPAVLIELDFGSSPEDPKPIRFGALLSDERRWFVLCVLRSYLAART